MVTQEVVSTGIISEPVDNESESSLSSTADENFLSSLVTITGDSSSTKCICGKPKKMVHAVFNDA